jgi:hypothetical protein
MRANLSLLGVAALATTLWSASAHAQGWLADRDRAQGSGIRLGNFELHPGIGAEAGYDSNVYLSDEPQDSPVVRIAPHLFLQTLGHERSGGQASPVEFRAGVNGSLKHYFETETGTSIGMGQDAKLTLRPGSIFTLELSEEFKRSIDPFTDPVVPLPNPEDPDEMVLVPQDVSFARDQLTLGTRLQLGTRGGVLKGALGYQFGIDHFEDDGFRDNRANSHTVRADTSWEFFPKTALLWDGTISRNNFIRSTDELSVADMEDLTAVRNDSTNLKTRLGLNGAITPRVSFTLAGGYGAGFFDAGDDYEAFIAQVEARWRPQETILWSLGYDRETVTAYQGNYAHMNRIKTGTQLMLSGIVVIQGRVELTFLDFGVDPEQGERDDMHFLANLSGEYRLADWFAITAEASYWQNFTDFVYVTAGGDGMIETAADNTEDPAKYNRFEGWLGVRAFL